jgi:hypothetical protein
MSILDKEPLKVVGKDGKAKVLPGYRQKSIIDHIIILLGVMTAISLFVILFDINYEMSYFPALFFDSSAFAAGEKALLDVYQNTFFGPGWARMMVTLLIVAMITAVTALIFYYIKDLVYVVREFYRGVGKAAGEAGEVIKDTVTQMNPFNIDPVTGEPKPAVAKKKKAKEMAKAVDISLEELDKALTDPNYVPTPVADDKKSLFDN